MVVLSICQGHCVQVKFFFPCSDAASSPGASSGGGGVVTKPCLSLCNSLDCSPPGSSAHGILPGKNPGVGCHFLLQEMFPTQGWNPGLLCCRWILYQLSTREVHRACSITRQFNSRPSNKHVLIMFLALFIKFLRIK